MKQCSIAFLQYALVEVIVMVNVQSPATNVRDVNVETSQGRCLRLPHDRIACRILVSDRDLRLGLAVYLTKEAMRFSLIYILHYIEHAIIGAQGTI